MCTAWVGPEHVGTALEGLAASELGGAGQGQKQGLIGSTSSGTCAGVRPALRKRKADGARPGCAHGSGGEAGAGSPGWCLVLVQPQRPELALFPGCSGRGNGEGAARDPGGWCRQREQLWGEANTAE